MRRMKSIFTVFVLLLSIQMSYTQACGIYRIKYVGKITSESMKIKKVKLPSIQFLHNLENENSELSFVEFQPKGNEINFVIGSHLTSHLYGNPQSLLSFYKSKKVFLPIILIVLNNGKEKEIVKKIAWESITISKANDEGFGNLFKLNLNEIKIE